ncbi:MAG: N-acetyltransferase [Deltaproteobacteria bacterium]|nr:N-acetyltransferase [Deltaproteobacteria bacterium]
MVRKAVLNDVDAIYAIVESFARKGDMLHRPLAEVYANLRDFFVHEEGGEILGTCALHICWEEIGEIRSLCVKEEASGRGVGRALVKACLSEAKTLGVKKVFALTYRPAFFEKMGFRPVEKEILPHKIWGDCIKCAKFPSCDENAVIIDIRP